MTNPQRTHLIEEHLRAHKYADLHSLAELFGGSLSTVRRALDLLESRGIVRRHHGGASLIDPDALLHEHDFITRTQHQADQKFEIARLVADYVAPSSTIILDGGTTTYAVARLLVKKQVKIITNSLPIASFFAEIGGTETIVTGGTILGRLGVLVGPSCEKSFVNARADLAILGAIGVTEGGVWNQHPLVIAAQRKMIAAAERTIFAIDASKFGRKTASLAAPFNPNITIITDILPTQTVARAIAAAGAQITLSRKWSGVTG
ncbi:MAG: hypothetical protein RL077_3654 [Verrucomicrobiota bacterium]|jgi:DeoR/GlpR family transcriptional regulator of sugar metabolism